MTLLYMFGLASGSVVAYGLEKLINPFYDDHCHFVYEVANTTVADIISTTQPSSTTTSIISTTVTAYLLSTPNSTEMN